MFSVDFKASQAEELNQLLAFEQDTLQVPDTEVEEWVIRGMGKRVIEGRIDPDGTLCRHHPRSCACLH